MAGAGYVRTYTRSGTGTVLTKPCIVMAVSVIDTNGTPAAGMVDISDGVGGALLCRLGVPTAAQFGGAEHKFEGDGYRCNVGPYATVVTGIGTAYIQVELIEAS